MINDRPPLVVMKNVTPEANVPLAPCPDRNSGQQFLVVGSKLRIITEEKLKVRVDKSVDPGLTDGASVGVISYPDKKRETMTIVTGKAALLGYPQVDALAHTDIFVVRVHQEGGVDISGSTQTGRHWRWAFLDGAHVEYYDVSPEVAKDSIVSSAAFAESTSSGHEDCC
jgi:hypothetical protein